MRPEPTTELEDLFHFHMSMIRLSVALEQPAPAEAREAEQLEALVERRWPRETH